MEFYNVKTRQKVDPTGERPQEKHPSAEERATHLCRYWRNRRHQTG